MYGLAYEDGKVVGEYKGGYRCSSASAELGNNTHWLRDLSDLFPFSSVSEKINKCLHMYDSDE